MTCANCRETRIGLSAQPMAVAAPMINRMAPVNAAVSIRTDTASGRETFGRPEIPTTTVYTTPIVETSVAGCNALDNAVLMMNGRIKAGYRDDKGFADPLCYLAAGPAINPPPRERK